MAQAFASFCIGLKGNENVILLRKSQTMQKWTLWTFVLMVLKCYLSYKKANYCVSSYMHLLREAKKTGFIYKIEVVH